MKNEDTKKLALKMALNCVRNTVLEDYHAEGKISQEEMKKLMIQVVDNIYTFLVYEKEVCKPNPFLDIPSNWDEPKINKSYELIIKAYNMAEKIEK